MASLPSTSLTNTLVLALSQCQEQIRIIQEHSSRIDQLQQENERLRKELQDVRERPTTTTTGDEVDQVQELFQKHVEAQAEIQSLKKKLRSHKERASKRSSLPLSSPLSAPVTPARRSPKQSASKRVFSEVLSASSPPPPPPQESQTAYGNGERNATSEVLETTSSTPPRKRAKPDSIETRDALKEVSTNLPHTRPSSPAASRRGAILKKIAAIPSVAEDGEEHGPVGRNTNPDRHAATRDDSVYHRLDGLLAGSTPVKPLLAKPGSRSPRPYDSPSTSNPRKSLNISNIQHATTEAPVSTNLPQGNLAASKPDDEPSRLNYNTARTTASHQDEKSSSLFRRSMKAAKVSVPLRTQPIANLMLSSFKPNPRWLSSHNISFDDFLNDRQYERMRTLATTLPHLPGETRDHHFTEHELLLEFLGPGSESRIANLTPVARQNLIVEAKTRRVAQGFKFSKPAADINQEDGPPGFWSTDMPGTQEAEENKEASRRKEREEVTRRYEDAISGQGRWVFADE